MTDLTPTRRTVLRGTTVAAFGSIAGCAENAEDLDSGRGERLDASESTGLEIPGGSVYTLTQFGGHFLELAYSVDVSKPEEGFEEPGPVDIIVVSEDVFRKYNLDDGIEQEFLDDPNAADIESLSQLDVDGTVEDSGVMEAGIYHLLIDNTASERTIEVDVSVDVYEYNRDMSESACDTDTSGLEIRNLSVHDPDGLEPDPTLRHHIAINETSGEEYSLSMDVMTDQDEVTISETQQRDICATHFVGVQEIDLNVNDGFFERNEEIRATVTVEKDGEPFAEEDVRFTAQSGY